MYDKRQHFYDVQLEPTQLSGTAEVSMQSALAAFATEQGLQSSINYLEPSSQQLKPSHSFMLAKAEAQSETINQVLHGESIEVFYQKNGYSLARRGYDGYLGWLDAAVLAPEAQQAGKSVEIRQARGHLYAAPRVSAFRLAPIALGMRFIVVKQEAVEQEIVTQEAVEQEKDWCTVRYADGLAYLHRKMLEPLLTEPLLTERGLKEKKPEQRIHIAQHYLHTPYCWGGVTAWGLDCSGLVQTVFRQQGMALPRDANQQEKYCLEHGQVVAQEDARAGDLAFFPGHVALCYDNTHIIHANAKHMQVSIDAWQSPYGQQLQQDIRAIYRL